MKQTIQTLYDFILELFTNPSFAQEHSDIKASLQEYGHQDITPEELHQAMALVADELPPEQARQLTSHLQQQQASVSGDSGGSASSSFNINQGGSAAAGRAQDGAATGAPPAPAAATSPAPAAAPAAPIAGEDQLDAVAREITYITNNVTTITETNTTNIDDRDTIVDNSVRQSINAGRDVTLDQDITNNTASGDGAVAGEVGGNVNTGQNSGIVGDADGARVTNVEGDGNTVLGDVGEDANVVTGQVGQFVGDSVSESNLIGGDNSGIAAADSTVTGATIGDGNTTLAGEFEGNLNLGGQQTAIEGGGNNLGSGDLITAQNAAVATGDHAEAASANVGGFGTGEGPTGGVTQVNVGSGDSHNENAVDASNTHSETIDVNQEATVNQINAMSAGNGDAAAEGEQLGIVAMEAGEVEADLHIELDQHGGMEAEAPEHSPMDEAVDA